MAKMISTIIPQILDGRFPDTDRVIPKPEDIEKQRTELREFSVNPQYLYDVSKVLVTGKNYLTTKIIFLEDMSVLVEFPGNKNIEYKIMLVRS